jgi:hypothetical protein
MLPAILILDVLALIHHTLLLHVEVLGWLSRFPLVLMFDLILGLWLWLSRLLKRLPGDFVSGTVVRDDSSGHVGTLRLILIARPTGSKVGIRTLV